MGIYKTNSLQLASFLYTKKDLTFKGIEPENPQAMFFVFDTQELAEEYTKEYFSGSATANPLNLFTSHKILKDMVFEYKRNGPRSS